MSLCWLCFFAAFDFLKLMPIPADNGHSSRYSVSALFANNELVLAFQPGIQQYLRGRCKEGVTTHFPPCESDFICFLNLRTSIKISVSVHSFEWKT